MESSEELFAVDLVLEDILDAAPRVSVLSDDEATFLEAVRTKNVDAVRLFLQEKHVDVNCMDAHGETALQLAVANDSLAVIRLLLHSGAEMGAALLQAVARESVECVQALLEYEGLHGGTLMRLESTTRFNRHTTPLMLAAQKDNYEIVKLLLSKQHHIEDSHKRLCDCPECKEVGRIGTALCRLDTYRALASPSFLSLSYLSDKSAPSPEVDLANTQDPMIRAFLLNRELEEAAESEYEFKQDYKRLSNQCEDYAVSLLNQCRSLDEIACIMNVPGLHTLNRVAVRGTQSKLSVLNFAIANKNEKVSVLI